MVRLLVHIILLYYIVCYLKAEVRPLLYEMQFRLDSGSILHRIEAEQFESSLCKAGGV